MAAHFLYPNDLSGNGKTNAKKDVMTPAAGACNPKQMYLNYRSKFGAEYVMKRARTWIFCKIVQ